MKRGINSTEMQKANRCLVLKMLLENGSMTRQNLSMITGLHKATITNIVNEFLEIGIISSDNNETGTKRGELLHFQVAGIYTLSIDINRKDYRICLYSLDGTAIHSTKQHFSVQDDVHKIYQQLLNDVRSLLLRFSQKNIIGICIGMPGPYIRKDHDIALVTGFEQLSFINIPNLLENDLNIRVLSEHDARLSAYAEWKVSEKTNPQKYSCLVALRSIGIGVGAGIVIDGRMVRGQIGIAGEIGHMGINFNARDFSNPGAGTFEYYAGTESAVRYMYERLYDYPHSTLHEGSTYSDIVNAYKENDGLAIYAMEKLAWMLGYGISSLVYLINPDCIIIGEEYPNYSPFLQKVRNTVEELVHPFISESLSICFSDLDGESILLGGHYLILEQYLKDNTLIDYIKESCTPE